MVNNKVVVKNTNEVWVPPDKGFVKFVFHEVVAMPSVDDAISDHYLDLLMKIVEAGKESDRKKDVDKKRVWLYLLCQDVYLTTAQVGIDHMMMVCCDEVMLCAIERSGGLNVDGYPLSPGCGGVSCD